MLQTMRSSAKFVFWILAVAFIGGFLLVETSGLLGRAPVSPTTAVASVNGTDILYTQWQQRTSQLVQQEQQQGRTLTGDDTRRLENQAFDEMVAQILLEQEYKKRGIVVSDDELQQYARFAPPAWVRNAPDLQTDGQFDLSKYQRLLASAQARQSGLLVALEQYFRTEVPKEKLFEQVTAGLYVTDAELWRSWRDLSDSASISYVALRPVVTKADSGIADSELRSYYDAHKSQFDGPGHAVMHALWIPRLVTAADTQAVRARAEALRAEIAGGTKFEDVARRESADTVSGAQGGDLGSGPAARFVPEFSKAAEALSPGQISQPVLTPFGYHLIRLDSRKGDTLGLHHLLLRIQPSDSNTARIDREADKLARLIDGTDPRKFDAAAASLGLTPFVVRARENELASYNSRYVPGVSAWAFGGASVGETSDLIDADDGYYVARLDSLMPGGQNFDAARGAVLARVSAEHALERLMSPAKAISDAARAGTLEAAASAAGKTVENTGFTSRAGASDKMGMLGEAIGAAFVAPLNTVGAPVRQSDAVYITRTDARKPADKQTFEAQKAALRSRRLEQLRQARVQMFLDDLRKGASIKDKRKEINEQLRRQSAT